MTTIELMNNIMGLLLNNINRLEVIDKTGRAYTHYLDEKESVQYSLQDGNRTLKIFIGSDEHDNAK
tara:strand:+ start:305 stop:502 length:198 start_codon:yes stop_codon:yes gene_type:complete